MKILITGGAGYIGSHTALELLASGFEPMLLDNFCNSTPDTLPVLAELAGQALPFIEGDIRDRDRLDALFDRHDIGGVIHLAGLKSVGESVTAPLCYYANNFGGTIQLLAAMARHEVRNVVFSSTAAVYAPSEGRVCEDAPIAPASPYARTKLAAEEMMRDVHACDPRWNVSILRYFNAGGAHPSSLIGERSVDDPHNLLPRITEVAVGQRERLEIFGGAHPTPDGTCVRDYVHVVDIARAHILAVERMLVEPGLSIRNLGSGRGHSVLDVVNAFERVSGVTIPRRIVQERPGELATVQCDPSRAREELGWSAEHDLNRICADLWRWCQSDGAAQCTA